MPEVKKDSLPTDPLQALGASLFLNIASYLPFHTLLAVERVSKQWRGLCKDREKTIWRAACHRTGVEKRHMSTLQMMEQAMSRPVWYGEPGEEEAMPPDEPGGSVGWKDICKGHVALDRNWRFGRCRERYLTPPGNSVWRIKVDPEAQTLFATDRTGMSIFLFGQLQILTAQAGSRPPTPTPPRLCSRLGVSDLSLTSNSPKVTSSSTLVMVSLALQETERLIPRIHSRSLANTASNQPIFQQEQQ